MSSNTNSVPARHFKDVEGTGERINLLVDTTTKRVLEHPADRYGVTQRAGGIESLGLHGIRTD